VATETTQTVWAATYDLWRTLNLTTVFGNPGSTEQPFLKNFPADFQYISCKRPLSLRWRTDLHRQRGGLHWSICTLLQVPGNGMDNIMTAFLNKTPLIITAGQQTRGMILC
jgi:benzoylformate decarboxylase